MKKLALIIVILLSVFRLNAQNDSIRLSLLTCGAGDDIYTLFGHSAIRYQNFTQGIDAVFNYGVFDFNSRYFFLRFAMGATDYQLAATNYDYFIAEYQETGRDVTEQELNLRADEKNRLACLLLENYRPENRVYRYNFFYDNCSTRPRDMIAKSVDGKIEYSEPMNVPLQDMTYRTLVRKYAAGHPWSRFGMEFCLGSEADRPITRRQMMFVPFFLKESFESARIADRSGKLRPLVSEEKEMLHFTHSAHTEWITPFRASLLLLIATLIVTIHGLKRKKYFWGYDLFLLAASGTMGIVPAFLVLFSTHPAVSPNYLLLIFNPIHLLVLPWVVKKLKRHQKSYYMRILLAVLMLFIIFLPVIPQKFNAAILPLALCLLVRTINHLFLTYKGKRL